MRLGRYEILDEIGRGAMGCVYRARDPEIDRIVALKVMVPGGALEPEAADNWRRRFQREARAAGRLTHPNIVAVFDVGEDRGRPFLVMEFVSGRTLDAILKAEGPLPLDRVIDIGEQVAAALDHAHEQGIVHRDVKPANILLTAEGSVKVTDFGIARIARDPTETAGVWGSPSYMSPEQVSGRPLDGRSDVFSLATVLYELLSGEKPFLGDTITTIAYRIIHEQPTPLHLLSPTLPSALGAWLTTAMAKEPGRRYQRAGDLARELRAAVERPAVPASEAPTERIVPPDSPHAARSSWRWLWIGVAGLTLAAAVSVLGRSKPPAPPPVPAPTPAPVAVPEPSAKPVAPPIEAAKADLAADRARLRAERERLAREQAELEAERLKAAELEAERWKAMEARVDPPAPPKPIEPAVTEPVDEDVDPTGKLRIRFVGNTVVSAQVLEAMVRQVDVGKLEAGRLSPQAVRSLQERINGYYAEQGYVLARGVVHRLGPRQGIEIEMFEGRVRTLRPLGFPADEQEAVLDAFRPVMQAGVIRKQEIAGAISRIAEHKVIARVRYEPSPDPGIVDLVVERVSFGGGPVRDKAN